MKDWFREHISAFNFMVAGWCAMATLECVSKEQYGLAALNAVLVYINFWLGERNK